MYFIVQSTSMVELESLVRMSLTWHLVRCSISLFNEKGPINVLVALYTPYAVLRLYGVHHHSKDVTVSRKPMLIDGCHRAVGTRTRRTLSRYHCQFHVSEASICHFEG